MFLNKSSNGYYYLYFNCELTHKRKKISCRTKHKPEAIKFLSNFKNNSETLLKQKSGIVYFIEDLKREILKYTFDNLQKNTSQIYRRVLNDMLRIIGNKPVKLITNRDIEFYKSVRLKEVKNTTVNIDLKTMKAIFNIALKWDWVNVNPTNEIKLLAIPQKEKLSFSDVEIKLLLNNINDAYLKNIVLTALYTGCRLNEVLNIQWKDIDFSNWVLTIRNKENFKTKTGKNRRIPISEFLYSLFVSDYNIITLNEPDNYIFLSQRKIKFTIDFISKKFKQVLRKLNFPEKFHFHCLRHTFITNLTKSGVNINYVKEIAGHSDLKTTLLYVHIVTEDLREAVNKVSYV